MWAHAQQGRGEQNPIAACYPGAHALACRTPTVSWQEKAHPVIPPRLLPDEPLPPYAYVPGRAPHPESDPAGHSFGQPRPIVRDLAHWPASRAYRRGIDLFNHGFYWEAHEQWEALWQAAGRRGPLADFFKGLIRLAAAGVKIHEGQREGAIGHATAAARLFRAAAPLGPTAGGLSLTDLIQWAEQSTAALPGPAEGSPIVFPFALVPDPEATS